MKEGAQFQLPTSRKKSIIETIDGLNFWSLIWRGLLIYLAIVLTVSGIECLFNPAVHFKHDNTFNFGDLVYFNFVSILTIGYGDISPKDYFRIPTIIEAILGLGIYSLIISIITIKLLLPAKNTIVFSKYAYYCRDDHSFMVIYLNTATQYITNLETSWYFKLNENWDTKPPVKVPFITTSVQTFYLEYLTFEKIVPLLHSYDCLRLGLSGNLGMGNYSTFVQYNLDEILVIPNRDELKRYPGFYQVDQHLKSTDFVKYFHYCPPGAVFLNAFVQKPIA